MKIAPAEASLEFIMFAKFAVEIPLNRNLSIHTQTRALELKVFINLIQFIRIYFMHRIGEKTAKKETANERTTHVVANRRQPTKTGGHNFLLN